MIPWCRHEIRDDIFILLVLSSTFGMAPTSRLKIVSPAPDLTKVIGYAIGRCLSPGGVVALQGELGSGKTWLTKGIAEGLGIAQKYEITSPTFTLVNEYPGRIPLFHMDAYRIRNIDDLQELGYQEMLQSAGVLVIEWADKIREEIPEDSLTVDIKYTGEESRELILSGNPIMIEQIYTSLSREGLIYGFNSPEIRWDIGC